MAGLEEYLSSKGNLKLVNVNIGELDYQGYFLSNKEGYLFLTRGVGDAGWIGITVLTTEEDLQLLKEDRWGSSWILKGEVKRSSIDVGGLLMCLGLEDFVDIDVKKG